MNITHRHLKLTDGHFDAARDDLDKALRDFDVSEESISKVVAVTETTRDDVTGRKEKKLHQRIQMQNTWIIC
ncbi:hypothetical protein K7432_017094 [Basidiobolus ranarum]|uniref:Uncharacterized protein n=1 Tax=Basidiobolus ranarum TaxID=34480 RepID=A0ABR2VKT2_9FUNG